MVLVQATDLAIHGAAHGHPHDDFRAFRSTATYQLRMRQSLEHFGLLNEQPQELLVPFGVVEAGAFAVDLVRQPAGADHDHLQVFREGFDGAPHGLAELVTARGGWQRVLEHIDGDRQNGARPGWLVRPHQRQRRIATMVERPVLEHGHVEFLVYQSVGDVFGKLRVAHDIG